MPRGNCSPGGPSLSTISDWENTRDNDSPHNYSYKEASKVENGLKNTTDKNKITRILSTESGKIQIKKLADKMSSESEEVKAHMRRVLVNVEYHLSKGVDARGKYIKYPEEYLRSAIRSQINANPQSSDPLAGLP